MLDSRKRVIEMMIAGAMIAMITMMMNGFAASRGIETGPALALILADIIAYFIILIGLSKLANMSLGLAALEVIVMIAIFAASYAYGRKTKH